MLTLIASVRLFHKKRATRRLRKTHKCPAVVYGKNKRNVVISLNVNEIQHPDVVGQLYKNNIITLFLERQEPILVKIQEIQYHPFKLKINHIDFKRV